MTDFEIDPNENDPAGGADPAAGTGGGSGEEAWSGPSREEWTQLQEANKRLSSELEGITGAMSYVEPSNNDGFDLSHLDMTDPYQAAWFMDQIVQDRLRSVTPYVKNAAQDQGQRQMQELLSNHEKELVKDFPAGFDHKLAERASFALFDETGDAQGSVAAGAKYAAEVRKQERDAAIEEYRKKNSRGAAFGDPDASGAGVKAPQPLKTYEEVMDKYISQTEI